MVCQSKNERGNRQMAMQKACWPVRIARYFWNSYTKRYE